VNTAAAQHAASRRADAALWYAWGAVDNDKTGRYDGVSVEDFVQRQREDAYRYNVGEAHFLHGVRDAWLIHTGEREDWRTAQHAKSCTECGS
jgi:hypothetical protein